MAAAFKDGGKRKINCQATFPAPKQIQKKPGVHPNNAKRDASRSIYGNLWEWKCLNSIVPNGDKHSSPLLVRNGKSFMKQVKLPLPACWICDLPSMPIWRGTISHLQMTSRSCFTSSCAPLARQLKPSAPTGDVVKPTTQTHPPTHIQTLMTHTPTSTSDIRRT